MLLLYELLTQAYPPVLQHGYFTVFLQFIEHTGNGFPCQASHVGDFLMRKLEVNHDAFWCPGAVFK